MATNSSSQPAAGNSDVNSPAQRQSFWRWAGVAFLRRREASIFIVGVLLVIYFQVRTSIFLTPDNVSILGRYAAATAIMSAGEVMVLICGELDLSIGMVFALSPFVMYLLHDAGMPMFAALILALLAACLVGILNGLITVLLKVHSFVTTMGMLFLIRGITLTISGGYPVQPQAGPLFSWIFGGSALIEFAWAIGLAILFQFILSKTRWGLHTIAVGGNLEGATEAGIKVKRIKVRNFMICSLFAGFAGILDTFHVGSIAPLAGGNQMMFMSIAAAVIGGTLLAGGVGTIIGALFGAIVLGILKDGFTLIGVSAYTFDIILGIAILATMVINVYVGRLRSLGGV